MSFSRTLSIVTAIASAGLICWFLFFKVSDSDVWWHLKAGQLLWAQKHFFESDPFAYARVGLPYLATHEWLAQLILAAVFKIGGATGLMLLRMTIALCIAATLLVIDIRRIWPNVLLVAAAILVMRQDLIERPQMFSNLLFAASVVLCMRYLSNPTERKKIVWLLFGIAALWSNLHGGEALLVALLFGTVAAQELFDLWSADEVTTRVGSDRFRMILLYCLLLICALLLTPNFFGTITYLWLLFHDHTAQFLNEWNPSLWPRYLLHIGPFAIVAAASMLTSRKNLIATGLMFLGLGYLSRTAQRHEILFVLTCLGITVYELSTEERWQAFLAWLERRVVIALGLTALMIAGLIWLNLPYQRYFQRMNLAGFGSFAPAESAVDFLEENRIDGKIFNTYTAGGYLLFRNKKVFIDGRNVDYGYDFVSKALEARNDPAVFRDLEKQYGFTVIVVSRPPSTPWPDFAFLDTFGDWPLVFVDDWSAIYLKRTADHDLLIGQSEYSILTPPMLSTMALPFDLTQETGTQMEAEAKRAGEEDPRGIASLILLSKLERARGAFVESLAHAREAEKRAQFRYEPVEIQASIAAAEKRWTDAAALYERTLVLIQDLAVTPPYEMLANVYEQAGQPQRAAKFRAKEASRD